MIKKGFTLVELVIILAILGTSVGIGVPSYVSFNENQVLEQAGKTFISNLQVTRQNAITGLKDSSVCGDWDLAGWCLSPQEGANGTNEYISYGSCINPASADPLNPEITSFPNNPKGFLFPNRTFFSSDNSVSQAARAIVRASAGCGLAADTWLENGDRILFQSGTGKACIFGTDADDNVYNSCDPSLTCSPEKLSYCIESNFNFLLGSNSKYIVEVSASGDIIDVGLSEDCAWEN